VIVNGVLITHGPPDTDRDLLIAAHLLGTEEVMP
jgi:hypothetical protein